MTEETARDTQESCTRVGLLGSQQLLARILAVAIIISGGVVMAVGIMGPAPVSAQSSLPTIEIKEPTTSLYRPSAAPTANEGDTLTWTVTRTGSTSSELVVPLTWYDRGYGEYETFFEFTDDNPKVTSVTFPPGAAEVSLSVVTDNDANWEFNTTLMICVSDPIDNGGGVTYQGPSSFQCAGFNLINDDDPPLVDITPDQAIISEGGRAAFTLTRHAADLSYRTRVLVTHKRVDSEGNVSSYAFVQTLAFEVDEATIQHIVRLRDNNSRLNTDYFTLRVTIADPQPIPGAPTGTHRLEAATRRAEVAVEDDELPLVTVSAPARQTEGEPVVFTFTRFHAREPLTINFEITQGGDYLPPTVPTTLTFEAGVLSKQVSLDVDDGVDELDGGVILTMLSSSNHAVDEASQRITVRVMDDDEPQFVTLERAEVSAVEGEDAIFTLTRHFDTGGGLAATGQAMEWPLVVNVTVTEEGNFIDGTAPTSVTFAADSATTTLRVPTVDDEGPPSSPNRVHSAYESNGSVTAEVAAGANYTAGLPLAERTNPGDAEASDTLIVEDNEPPRIQVSVLADLPDGIVATSNFVSEGVAESVYVKRLSNDNSEALTVRVGNTNLTCHDPNASNSLPRDLAPAEIPFDGNANRIYTANIPPGQDTMVVVISTQQDNAAECDIRWDVEVVPPSEPPGVTRPEWMQRYNEWDYHPLRPNTASITMHDDDELPNITFTHPSVSENAGTVEVIAELRTEAIVDGYEIAWPITLHWWTIPQTAFETLDFNRVESRSVTFTVDSDGGPLEKRLPIAIIDNHTPEETETFQLGYRLSTYFSDDFSLALQGGAPTVTIIDDDQPPTVSAARTIDVQESAGSVVIALELDQPSDLAVAVDWTTEDGTSKSGSPPLDDDFVAASGTYTFIAGTTAGEISIDIRDDPYDEDAENFHVRMSSPTNGAIGTPLVTVTIADDDQEPNVVLVSPYRTGIPEGLGTAELRVELRTARSEMTVSGKEVVITYSAIERARILAEYAATVDSDFVLPNSSLTIPAGNQSGAISVDVVDDLIDEPNEFFGVEINTAMNASGAAVATSRVYAYIRDDDPLSVVTIEDAIGSEPTNPADIATMQFPVVLDRASGKMVRVNYRTTDRTARSLAADPTAHDDDYESTMGTLVFAPGETRKNISVTVKGDVYVEPDEEFVVSLASAFEATLRDGSGVGTIQDSSRLPIILLDSTSPGTSVGEDVGEVRFTFSLNQPDNTGVITSGRVTTIDYRIVPYTPPPGANTTEATRGTDYHLPANGTLTFAAGTSTATLDIQIVDDQFSEFVERFNIRFDNPVNATYTGLARSTIAIRDNDEGPRIEVADARAREDRGPLWFDVTLNKPSNRTVSFRFNTQMGTAFEYEDYEAASGTVMIAPGETYAEIEIEIINDGEQETIEEQFTLFLRDAAWGVLVDSEAVGYIVDDDQVLPPGTQTEIIVSSGDVTVPEGNSAGASINVRLSSAPSGTVVVTLSGASGTDLTINPVTLMFNTHTWETDQPVMFTSASDADAEDDSHKILLSADGGGYARVSREVLVTVEDDDTAGIAVSRDALTVVEAESANFTVVLESEPVSPVTVTISKSAGQLADLADVGLDQTSLNFSSTDWQTPQTVTVSAREDEDAFDETVELLLVGFGTGYAGRTSSVLVTTDDDDTAGLVLRDSGGNELRSSPAINMMERESTYITVALASRPTAAVNIDASVTPLTELTVDTDDTPGTKTLVFDAQNWNVPQHIDIVSLGDDDAIQDAAIPVTFSMSGGDYNGLTVPDLHVTVTETDVAGLVFSPDSFEVDEGDATGTTYSVRLEAQPLVNRGGDSVTVTISPSAGSGLTVMPSSVTFNRSDWNVPRMVSVTAASDDDAADSAAVLTHAASGAAEYVGVSADVAVTIRDDDEAELVISHSFLLVNEGGMAPYRVQLATEPTGDVRVVISGHDSTDFSLDNTSLLFTSINWNTPQSVQVSAGHDDDAESDVVTLSHTASGSDYGGVAANVTVRTLEDEQESLTVSNTRISLDEGTTETFSVALASRPSTSLTVDLSVPQDSGLEFDKTSLTYSVNDWSIAQTVTITSSHDEDAADENVDVRLEVGSGTYGADAVVIQVEVVDDDSARIVLSHSRLNVIEGFSSPYTVRLATQPTGPVTIDLSVPAGTDISVRNSRLSFNADNWMTDQTVTVAARYDLDADTDPAITVTHTASGGDYGMLTETLTVVVSDVDVKGLVFLDSDGNELGATESLDIDEGGSASYSVSLASRPSAQTVVTLSPGAGLSVRTTSLAFTPSDWSRAQTVIVTASHDDDTSDGAAVIAHAAAGGGYGSVARSLDFVIADDDTPTIVLTDSRGPVRASDGLTVTEGATAVYRVQLATEPSTRVTVEISGTVNTDLATDKTSLTFTSTDWNIPQSIRVTAARDDDAATDAKATLNHAAMGAEYDSVMADISVTIVENDADGFIVTDTAGDPLAGDTLTVPEGGSAAYKISLSAEPAGPVTVMLSGTADTDLQLDKTDLTFMATNWSTPQTVTATAAHDGDAVDDAVTLVHTPNGAGYAGLVFDLNAVIDDDDRQSVITTVDVLTVPEGGTSSVGVSLGTEPTDDVTVGLTVSMGADIELPTMELTFTTQNWMTAQSVSVVGLHDADATDDSVQIGFNANGGDYQDVLAILLAIISDDDEPAIVLNEDSLEVTEGSTADFTVRLATQPPDTVTVTISGSAATSLTLTSTRLVFTPTDWSTPKTVTAAAAHDNNIDDEMIQLSLAASGGDYDTVTETLTVIVIDNVPDVSVRFGSGSYSVAEGGSVSVSVSLSGAPERALVVPIEVVSAVGATSGDYTVAPMSVSFGVSETSKTLTFSAAADDDDDDDESVVLGFDVSALAGVSVGSPAQTTVSIDDDAADVPDVSVRFGSGSYSVAEGGSVSVSVSLSGAPERALVVPIEVVSAVGATSGDYTVAPMSVSFGVSETSKTLTFSAAADDDDDDDESVVLGFDVSALAGVSVGSPAQTTVSIDDDAADVPDVSVRFGSGSYSVAEGGSVSVSVSLSGAPERALVVPIEVVSAVGATSGDYTVAPMSVSFGVSETSKTLTFSAAADDDDDDDESVVLGFDVSALAGVSVGSPAQTTVSIDDDAADVPDVSVRFGSGSYSVAEGGSVSVSVSLSGAPERALVVPIEVVSAVGATSGDYTVAPMSVSFGVSETSKTLTFSAAADDDDDDDESVVLGFDVSALAGVSVGSPAQTTVSIDDDAADVPDVSVRFGSGSYSVAEGGSVSVSVSLSGAPERALVVPIEVVSAVGATSGDYTVAPMSVSFGVSETSKTLTFSAAADDDDDDDESVVLGFDVSALAGVSVGSPAQTTVSIDDDAADVPDVSVRFGSGSYSVAEGGSVSVSVSLSGAPERALVVPIEVVSAVGATSGDYTVAPMSVSFGVSETSKTLTFSAAADDDDDDDESVVLGFDVSALAGVSVGSPAQTTVSIDDDAADVPDVSVRFGSGSYSVAEGGSVSVSVSLSGAPERALVVPIEVVSAVGATSGDYTVAPMSVSFGVSETSKTLTFSAAADDDDDDDESVVLGFDVSALAGVSVGSPAQTTVSIDDDAADVPDVSVRFGSGSYSVAEGGSVSVSVSLSGAPERALVVPIEVVSAVGATSGDYTVAPMSVSFGVSETSKTLTFSAAADDDDDDDESVVLGFDVSALAGVSVGSPAQTTVSIDDDAADVPDVSVRFGSGSYSVAEGGSVSVSVSLSGAPERALVVPIEVVSAVGATSGDYTVAPMSVSFGVSETSKTLTFSAAADDDDDDDESVVLGFDVSALAGVSVGSPAQTTVSIDDDAADVPDVSVRFGSGSYSVAEGGSVSVSVSLSGAPERALVVPIEVVSAVGATSGDYTVAPMSVSFGVSETSKTLTFSAAADDDDDDDESVVLGFDVSALAGVSVGSPAQTTVSIDDDAADVPDVSVRFGSGSYSVAEGGSVSVSVSLSGAPERALVVPIEVVSAVGATSGDYTVAPMSVSFGVSETSKTLTFSAAADDDDDDDESVVLGFDVSALAGVSVGSPAQTTVSIDDDAADVPDVSVRFGSGSYSVAEGGSVSVSVSLSGAPERALVVPIEVVSAVGATSGDYTVAPMSVSFGVSETSKTLTFSAAADDDDDDDESVVLGFDVSALAGVSVGSPAQTTVSIDDDAADVPDVSVRFGSGSYSVAEGGSVSVSVSLSGAPERALVVPIEVVSAVGATSGDYTVAPMSVSFGVSETSKTLTFSAAADDDDDDDESVVLGFDVSALAGVSVGSPAQTTVSIDDDAADVPDVSVRFGSGSYSVAEGGSVSVSVSLSGAPERALVVPIEVVSAVGATSGDYTVAPMSVSFGVSETSKTLTFSAAADDDDDDDESVVLGFDVSALAGVSVGSPAQTTVSIDDDAADVPDVSVRFGSGSYSVAEGGSVSVSVSLSGAPERALVVPIEVVSAVGATSGDYTVAPMSVSFGVSETSKTLTFSAAADDDDDDDESVVLGFDVSALAGVSVGSPAQTTVSIDDDAADVPDVSVRFGSGSYSVAEGGSVSVSVSLSGAPERALVVPIEVVSAVGATSGDYTVAPMSVSFGVSETSKTLTFSAAADDDDDDDESVVLGFDVSALAGVSVGSPAQTTVSIDDDAADVPDVSVRFGSGSYSVAEGGSVSVSVSLSGAPERALVVPIEVVSAVGATSGDYTVAPMSVSFGVSETSKTLTFSAAADDDDDDDESVVLGFDVSALAGVSVGSPAQTTVSIDDDAADVPDVSVRFGSGSYSVAEGGSVSVSVSLSGAPERALVVPIEVVSAVGATSGDYTVAPMSVSFGVSETSKTLTFSAAADDDDDDDESVVLGFDVSALAGVSVGSPAQTTVSIDDDAADVPDVSVRFGSGSYSVAEGGSVSVSVSLSGAPERALVVPIEVVSAVGATSGDYTVAPMSVSFGVSETSKTLTFSAAADDDDDDDESVVLGFDVSALAGVSVGSPAQTTVSIDDDAADVPDVSVRFGSGSYSVAEGGSVSVSVSLSGAPERALVVPIEVVSAVGATSGDYTVAPMSVSFGVSETSKTLTFSAAADDDDDDDESVVLGFDVSALAGVSVGSPAQTTVSIDDDAADVPDVSVRFGSGSYSVAEGGSVSVSVSLSGAPERALVVPIEVVSAVGATSGDYTVAPMSVSFGVSETSKTLTFSAAADDDDDDDESVVLGFDVSALAGVSVGSPAQTTVSIDDDAADVPDVSVRFGSGSYSVAEGGSVSVSVSLSGAPERALVVPIEVVSAVGATSGDYTVAPMSVSFGVSETSKTLTFSAAADDDDDDDESVVLGFDVSALAGVSVGSPAQTTVSIDDDAADVPDVSVRFGSGSYSVAEGGSVSVSVSLSGAPERALVVPIEVVSAVGATSGDYTVAPMSVSFGVSETSKTLTFSAAADDDDDDDESVVLGFDVSALAGVSVGSPAQTTVSIDDDAADVPDVSVRFGSGSYSVAEGGSVSVSVSLSGAPERALVVPIEVVSAVGATSGDYTVAPMSVSFGVSETSKTLTFSAAADDDDDDDESVVLGFDVSALAGVSVGSPAQTTVSIDDDAADVPDVSVRFGSGSYSVAEGGSVSVSVSLSGAPERALVVPIEVVSAVGATSGDYTVAPMSVSFGVSETSKTLTFSAAADDDDDDDESVVLGFDVSALAGVSVGSPAQTTVSIDDDAADVPDVSVRFGSGSYSVAEGGSVSVSVSLSGAPERALVVPIEVVSAVGATSGDYTVAPMSVSFGVSETSKTLTFSAAADDDDDDDESVVLGFDVSALAGVSVGSPAQTTVSIDDDAADVPDVSVRFGSGSYSVAEGGSVSVSVSLSGAPERALVVPIEVVSAVGATSGDYTVAPMSVSFGVSETSKTLTFSAAADDDDDDDESVVLGFDVSALAGVSVGSPAQTTVSIDDDAADVPDVSVRFGSGSYSVAEGGSVSVSVSLSGAPERALVVPIEVVSAVGATSGDYTVAPMSVSFGVSETSKTLTFSAAADDDDDDDESVVLGFDVSALAGVSVGSPAQTTVSIDDDAADVPDVSVRFGSGSYSVAEGGSVSVSVSLSGAPERALVVPIEVVSAVGATSGDYTVAPMSVSFGVSETSKTLTFSAAADDDDDDDESVVLGFDVSALAGVSVGSPAQTTVSIDDDAADVPDVSVRFGSGSYSVAEGGSVSVSVSLSGAPERALVVPIEVVSAVGATSGDYTVAPMSVSFGVSETSKTLTFSAAADDDDDDDESVVLGFDVSALAGVSVGSPAQTTVSIDDDAADVPDVSVRFGSGSYSVAEGGSVSVSVSLSGAPERALVVPIEVVSAVGATSGDYTVAPMSVSFGVSETSKTLTFSAAADDDDDDDESVVLGFDVSALAGVSVGSPAQTTVSIDDDAADVPDVSVRFGSGSYSVAEGGSVSVSVSLSGAPERALVVPIEVVSAVGATSGDYTVAPMSVSFGVSETSKTLTFSAAADDDDDDDESVVLGFDVSALAGVSVGSPAQTTVSIDDDAADVPDVSVRFGSGSYSVAEGGSVSVSVSLSGAPERALVVPIEVVSAVGATSGDYTVAPMSVSFGVSETSKTLTFSAAADDDDDDDESVVLGFDVSALAGVSVGSPAQTTVSIDDDAADVPDVSVRFGSGSYSVAEGGSVSVSVSLSGAPERALVVPIEVVSAVGATSGDYTVAPMSVSFGVSETSKTLTFSAAADDDDDDDESVVLGFDVSALAGVSVGSPAQTTVSIDDEPRPPRARVDRVGGGTVVTIVRVPDGTVIPDNSSLTVEDGSTFIEGTRVFFRLEFEAVGGGSPTGGGVDVEVSYFWHYESPLLSPHGRPTRGMWSLPLVDSWDTGPYSPDNDVGHPDGTVTLRITGCWRNDCIIGTPSEITLTIVDDDGGPDAAIPGPPNRPRIVCAPSGDGYDDTAIAVSWNAPNFVGGAPVESYELRYRETAEFVSNRLVLHEWEYWPNSVAARSTILTELVAGVNYTVQVRAVNGNGPGSWSESHYFSVGQPDEICEFIDQLIS